MKPPEQMTPSWARTAKSRSAGVLRPEMVRGRIRSLLGGSCSVSPRCVRGDSLPAGRTSELALTRWPRSAFLDDHRCKRD